MTSAQEQVDEASAAMDAIVKEVESLEQNHTKQKVHHFISISDK